MTRKALVRLRTNGKWWQAAWRDEYGREIRRGIGSKAKMNRREALAKCQEMAAGRLLAVESGGRTLKQYLERYAAMRLDLAAATDARYAAANVRLLAFFGADTRIDRITPEQANDFIAHLKTAKALRSDRGISDFTAWGIATYARQVFEEADRDGWVESNPFRRLRIVKPKADVRTTYIDDARVEKVLEHCQSAGWRIMFGLCRWAGLRAMEAMSLEIDHVDWDRKTLAVWPRQGRQTTKQHLRHVPISPRLYTLLIEAREAVPDGQVRLCWDVDPANYLRAAQRAMKRAGDTWNPPFQSLRRSLVKDWKNVHPGPVVNAWLGHSEKVSEAHYFGVLPEMMERVTGA